MSSQETEKWGGYTNNEDQLTNKKKKKSFYIRNDFLEADLKLTQGKKPEKIILKNANALSAKTHTIGGVKYSVENTCAFDSIK